MSLSKKPLPKKFAAGVLASALALAGCSSAEDDANTIRVATSPGPYSELFQQGIDPLLQEQGYSLEYTNFSDLQQAETSVAEGDNDLIVDQHSAYMEVFNDETGSNLAAIIEVPTVPSALYSKQHAGLDDVAEGHSVGIPQDASNKSRALNILVDVGWVTLKPEADRALLSEADIEDNIHQLEIRPMDSAQLPRALDDVDWAVIPGSISYSSNVNQEWSHFQENLRPELILVAATQEEQVDSQWAQDVADAYQSPEFEQFMAEENENGYWYIPDYN